MDLIFISSPQIEFSRFRRDLCYFILTDPYLRQYFNVFLFENLPANQQNVECNYLNKVEECSIYLGLFGKTYGTENDDGISATEHEYNYATELEKDRLIYLRKFTNRTVKEPKMATLINKAEREVTYSTFTTIHELKIKVMQSLLYWQQNRIN
jgi:ATP-dependent DNA helicase RecG